MSIENNPLKKNPSLKPIIDTPQPSKHDDNTKKRNLHEGQDMSDINILLGQAGIKNKK